MLLAFDACGDPASIACLTADGRLRSSRLPAGHGKADQLPALLAEMLDAAKLAQVTHLATSIGPGSYTGLRACLALVKGLALARRWPVYGMSAFDCLAVAADAADDDLVLVHAGRGRVWGQRAGDPEGAIRPLETCLDEWQGTASLIGDATALAQLPAGLGARREIALDAELVARIAALRAGQGVRPVAGTDILPLYLRGADAQLSAGKSLLATIASGSTTDTRGT